MHVPLARLLSSLLVLASLAAQETVRWHGVELDLPKGWTTSAEGDVQLLVPPGWKAGEQTGEAYGMLFDGEILDLGAEDLGLVIDGAAEELVTGMVRQGKVAAGKLGALDARTFRYTTKNGAGDTVSLLIHVFLAKDGACALFVLGLPDKLAAREKELTALLGSLRLEGQKGKRRAFGMGKQGGAADGATKEAPAEAPADAPGKPDVGEAPPAAFRRLPGGVEVAWNGVLLDVPKDWRRQDGDDGTVLLLPPGFGASGVLEEVYALCGDGSLQSLDGPDTMGKLQEALDEVQPGLSPRGAGTAGAFGALRGKSYVFTGSNEAGQQVEARVFAFPMQSGIGALLALGFPKALQARQATVTAMLGSLRPAPRGAAGAGGAPAELAGEWVYFGNVNATNGGGSQSQRMLVLRADGSYTFRAESVSTNPNGAAWGNQNDAGRWSVDGARITFRSSSGEVRACSLQKRNHPKNGDPMLVIDGSAFVTSTQRRPW